MHSVNRAHGRRADPGTAVVAVAVARSQGPLPLDDDDPGAPGALRLLATDHYDVWLVTWPPGSGRDFHGHGPVRSVLHVLDGELVEIFSDDGDASAAGSRL